MVVEQNVCKTFHFAQTIQPLLTLEGIYTSLSEKKLVWEKIKNDWLDPLETSGKIYLSPTLPNPHHDDMKFLGHVLGFILFDVSA